MFRKFDSKFFVLLNLFKRVSYVLLISKAFKFFWLILMVVGLWLYIDRQQFWARDCFLFITTTKHVVQNWYVFNIPWLHIWFVFCPVLWINRWYGFLDNIIMIINPNPSATHLDMLLLLAGRKLLGKISGNIDKIRQFFACHIE